MTLPLHTRFRDLVQLAEDGRTSPVEAAREIEQIQGALDLLQERLRALGAPASGLEACGVARQQVQAWLLGRQRPDATRALQGLDEVELLLYHLERKAAPEGRKGTT